MLDGKEKSQKLIKDFVDKFCDEEIEKLKDFSFLNLRMDGKFRQEEFLTSIETNDIYKYGGYFHDLKNDKYTSHQDKNDYDDMNLIRAINYLLYADKLPELEWKDLDWEYKNNQRDYNDYKYRGETINTFNILINESNYKEFFKDIEGGKELITDIDKFLYKVFTIGNFMLLPNKRIKSKSLNQYKGFYLGDYSDKFFSHILKGDNEIIEELLKTNSFYFQRSDKDFIENFKTKNYLKDYFNENHNLEINFSEHYKYWNFNKATKERKIEYADFIKEYIDKVTFVINKRAERMIEDLKIAMKS